MSKTDRGAELPRTTDALIGEVTSLLTIHDSIPNRLISREGVRLEYKQSYHSNDRAEYAKVLASFANRKGGFIVFGVKDSPRDLVGLDGKRLRKFDTLDEAKFTQFLNNHLAPAVDWFSFDFDYRGFRLGAIGVHPAEAPPVIALHDDGPLGSGEIYYRYRGQSTKAKYSELVQLIDRRRDRERDAWLRHMERVARVGPQNVAVVDFVSGELSGVGGEFLLSEDLLNDIEFVREGHFVDQGPQARPTLKLVGSVKAVPQGGLAPTREVEKPKAITEVDILVTSLRRPEITSDDAMQYLKAASVNATAYAPVRFFGSVAKLGVADLVRVLEELGGRSGTAIARRLESDSKVQQLGRLDGSMSAARRATVVAAAKSGRLPSVDDVSNYHLAEGLTHLDRRDLTPELLQNIAARILRDFDTAKDHTRTMLRKAITCIDDVLA